MNEPKPMASLSPSLLARKGGARPAMRPQMAALAVNHHEDLGWNDMGHEAPDPSAAALGEVVPIVPETPITPAVPEVVRRQRAIARTVERKRRSALAEGRRAAFTLRVDADRHLRLRLACTLKGCSAQQLVIQALDRLLEDLPEVSDLAARVASRRP